MKKWKSRRKLHLKMLVFVIAFCVFLLLFVVFCRFLNKGATEMEAVNVQTEEKYVIDMEGLSQNGIPTGCEAVSAVMVLNYLGIEITPEEFINEYLPMEGFYRVGDCLYGPDPEEKFAGDPFKKSSLGCFPPVVVEAIGRMNEEISAYEIKGKTIDAICKEYVVDNIPVLVWVTIDMCEPKEGFEYLLSDGTEYTWTAGEHCMVLCGFDDKFYYLKDPLAAGKTVKYEKELVEKRYEQMGSRGVVVSSWAKQGGSQNDFWRKLIPQSYNAVNAK